MNAFGSHPWRLARAASLVLALLLPATVFAQSRMPSVATGYQKGTIQVKITEAAQSRARVRTASGAVRTGIASLDLLNAQHDASAMRRLFRSAGRHEARHRAWGLDRWYVIELSGTQSTSAALEAYAASPDVEVAELRYDKEIVGAGRTLDAPPDDPFYGRQWHYHNDGTQSEHAVEDADIDLPEAWALETGHPDVVVQVIDTGIDPDHPDLIDQLWVNAGEDLNGNGVFDNAPAADGGDLDGLDNDDNGYVDDVIGYNHAEDLPIPEAFDLNPYSMHGTHTAGTIGARTNNGLGVAGIAGGDGTPGSGVRLMISQVYSSDMTSLHGTAEAIVYGADNGAVISNNSWHITGSQSGVYEQATLDAIDYFVATAGDPAGPLDGGLFVAAAGNYSFDGEVYPAAYEPALAVAGLDDAFKRSEFTGTTGSNYGSWVDVAAPGGSVPGPGILSTTIVGDGSVGPDGAYDYASGTSMASPHVAGIAALVASYEWRRGNTLTQAQLRARVASPTTTKEIDAYNPGYEGLLGVGLASAYLAITAPDADVTPPEPITDLTVDQVVGNAVVLSFTVPEDAGAPTEAGGAFSTVSGIDLRYSTDPITEATFDTSARADVGRGVPDAGETVEVTIEALDYRETYYFSAKATDRSGNVSALSNGAQVTTGAPAFAVDHDAFALTLDAGTATTRLLTVTNTSTVELALELEIVGAASAEIEYVPSGLSGRPLAFWRAQNERAWAGEYPRAREPVSLGLAPPAERTARTRLSAPPGAATNLWAVTQNEKNNSLGTFDLGAPRYFHEIGYGGVDVYGADFVRGVDDRIFGYARGAGGAASGEGFVFGSIDLTTGAFHAIGDGWDGDGYPFTLAGDLTTSDLYVLASTMDLYAVDRFAGEASYVSTLHLPEAGAFTVVAIAIDAQGVMYALDSAGDQLLTVDIETGAMAVVGPIGFDAEDMQGMDFDPTTGRLYMAASNFGLESGTRAELRIADRQTGHTTLVGKINGSGVGHNQFLAIPGEGFVSTDLLGTTLPAGASVDVEVTADAAHLLAGDYDAAVRVTAPGLLGAPAVDVPVALTVKGEPEAAVDREALAFDDLFRGGTARLSFALANEGTDALVVSDIASDTDAFVVYGTPEGETSFSLEPGESTRISVDFVPTTTGGQSGTVTVTTSDLSHPTRAVAVTGTGIPAPVAAISVEKLDVQAYPDQTYTRTFEIANTGGSPLTYTIEQEAHQPPLERPEVLFSEDFDDGIPTSWTAIENSTPAVPWQTNSDYGRVNPTGTGLAAMASVVDAARMMPFDSEIITPEITLDGRADYELEFLVNFQAYDGDDVLDVDITTDGGETWTTMIRYDSSLPDEFLDRSGIEFLEGVGVPAQVPLGPYVGPDATFQVRWRYHMADEGTWAWFASIDDVAVTRSDEWLTVTPRSGQVGPGESATVTLAFDAVLPPGDYRTDLLVTTNEPLGNETVIEVGQTIIESVAVELAPDTEDLEVWPNEEFLVPITVASLDDLEVESFQFTLHYDEDEVDATGVVTEASLSEGATITADTDVDGQIRVAVAELGTRSASRIIPRAIGGEPPVLLYVQFRAKESLGESELSFGGSFQFNAGDPPVSASDARVDVVPLYGDASLNAEVSSSDAALILDAVVGADDLGAVAEVASDVSEDGTVSAFDASLLLRFLAGDAATPCLPVSCRSSALEADLTGGEAVLGTVRWGAPEPVREPGLPNPQSGVFRLPLSVDPTGDVRALSVEVPLDVARIVVQSVAATLPEGWLMAHHVEDGALRVALSGPTPLPDGEVAVVTVRRTDRGAPVAFAGSAQLNESTSVAVASVSIEDLPTAFALQGAFPNPFTRTTSIVLDLPSDAEVDVELFDLIGRRVYQAESALEAGAGQALALRDLGLASGLYLYRVTANLNGRIERAAGRLTIAH